METTPGTPPPLPPRPRTPLRFALGAFGFTGGVALGVIAGTIGSFTLGAAVATLTAGGETSVAVVLGVAAVVLVAILALMVVAIRRGAPPLVQGLTIGAALAVAALALLFATCSTRTHISGVLGFAFLLLLAGLWGVASRRPAR